MKLYKIITEFQSYKWYVFALHLIVFAWGVTDIILVKSAKVPALLFTGMLVIWCIIWTIGAFDYINYMKGKK